MLTLPLRAVTGIGVLLTVGILVSCSTPGPTSPGSASDVESTDVAEERVDIPTGLEARSFAEGIDDAELLSWVEAAIGEMKDPPPVFSV